MASKLTCQDDLLVRGNRIVILTSLALTFWRGCTATSRVSLDVKREPVNLCSSQMNYELPLPQAKASDTSQPTRWQGALAPEKCIALPFLHSFSGCETVSSFAGRGKNDVTPAFCTLASTLHPSSIDDQLEVLEHFVVVLYDRASTEVKVNKTRKQLFSQTEGRSMDGLPPT